MGATLRTNNAISACFLATLLMGPIVTAAWAQGEPAKLTLRGHVMIPLDQLEPINTPTETEMSGTYPWRIEFHDQEFGGGKLGPTFKGRVTFTDDADFSIGIDPPDEVLAHKELYCAFYLRLESGDMVEQDLFGSRIRVQKGGMASRSAGDLGPEMPRL